MGAQQGGSLLRSDHWLLLSSLSDSFGLTLACHARCEQSGLQACPLRFLTTHRCSKNEHFLLRGLAEMSGIEGRLQDLPMTACVQSVKPQEQAFLAVSLEDLVLQTFCAGPSSLAFGVLAHSGGFTSAQLRGATACTEQLCRLSRSLEWSQRPAEVACACNQLAGALLRPVSLACVQGTAKP